MDIPDTVITQSASETQEVGRVLGSALLKGDGPGVVALWGDLGSGKTTFVQGLAKGLGIRDRLVSPTFIIVRRYPLVLSGAFFYHLDLYRMSNEKEILGIGWRDMFSEPGSVVAIEWPERLGTLLPDRRIDITLSVLPDGKHRLDILKMEDGSSRF